MSSKSASKRPKFQRERIYTIIARELRRCAREGREHEIDDALNFLGWSTTSSAVSIADMIQVAIMVAPLADDDSIGTVADMLICEREKHGGTSDDDANEVARGILAPLGVRYAECGCLAWAAGSNCCGGGQARAREAREARALEVARKAVGSVSDDPEVLRALMASVALMGERELSEPKAVAP